MKQDNYSSRKWATGHHNSESFETNITMIHSNDAISLVVKFYYPIREVFRCIPGAIFLLPGLIQQVHDQM